MGDGADVEVGPYQFWVPLAGGVRKNVLMFGLLRLASVSFRLMRVPRKKERSEGRGQKSDPKRGQVGGNVCIGTLTGRGRRSEKAGIPYARLVAMFGSES